MIRDIVRAVEIFTKVSDPPEMLEKIMYRVIYRDGSKDEFTHDEWNNIVTKGSRALTSDQSPRTT
jgi:hypothetical protein